MRDNLVKNITSNNKFLKMGERDTFKQLKEIEKQQNCNVEIRLE